MSDSAGKVAFITGGASGLGFGMAQAFCSAGMKVVIADIRQDHLDQSIEHFARRGERQSVHPIRVDVTDRKAMAAAADETERVFGKVHVVCNNAGINLFNDIAAATWDDWDWVLGVNLGGVVNGVHTFLPRIRKHGEGGHIVNTASMAAFIAGPSAGIYTCAKFAVRGLSEALRFSAAPLGIRVSVVCPGLIDSAIYESDRIRPTHLASTSGPLDPGFVSRLAELHHRAGMAPLEAGERVLRGMRRGDFYIFTHPEFKDELREIFDEALAALPDEQPPAERLAFEERRRALKAQARASWKGLQP
ncbi:MAG TPA: SDR family NAD(P)-dependent oxidoreductase [Steroidobacteraceae bacterium]|nr:SDR family NAD(P)-dependent oxidoreductase [Steroidobacteraceae bacterium]